LVTHRHVNVLPGVHLISIDVVARDPQAMAAQHDGCLDWKWLTVKDGKEKIPLDLTIDPTVLGTLDVAMPNAPAHAMVAFVPLDDRGELPLPVILPFYSGLRMKVANGRATIHWLKEGK
jgi:hypothetical protein